MMMEQKLSRMKDKYKKMLNQLYLCILQKVRVNYLPKKKNKEKNKETNKGY